MACMDSTFTSATGSGTESLTPEKLTLWLITARMTSIQRYGETANLAYRTSDTVCLANPEWVSQ